MPSKQYAIRRMDGRLIEVTATRDQARARVRGRAEEGSFIWPAEPALAATTVELHGKPSLAALEFVLNLDPATCEREFMVEVREKLARRYPGGDLV
jgi:hypothetical protein